MLDELLNFLEEANDVVEKGLIGIGHEDSVRFVVVGVEFGVDVFDLVEDELDIGVGVHNFYYNCLIKIINL